MKSIRTKIILLFCSFVLGTFLLIGSVGFYYLHQVVVTDSERTMEMLAGQQARELNVYFEGIERAVTLLCDTIRDEVDVEKLEKDTGYRQEFLRKIAADGLNAAEVSDNVYALYFRMDPEQFGMDAGFFITDNGYGEYFPEELTDLGSYDKDDREHVAWYYEPIENGQAMWLKPYMNKNIDVYMTSYVSPVYVKGRLIGVVGMDLDMTLIQNVVNSLDYLEGSGFLLSKNGDIIYHIDYPEGLSAESLQEEFREARSVLLPEWTKDDDNEIHAFGGKEFRIVTQELKNGMILAIAVPKENIEKPIWSMIKQISTLFGVILLLVILVIWRVIVSIISPLHELTDAASRIAKGEMNVRIGYHSENEIGRLSESIQVMEDELKEYILYMHTQAYTDAMTGVGNKASYLDLVRKLERKIQEGMADFVVVVFDLNGLKGINDQLGHEAGDAFIVDAANAIKNAFGAEHAYRIGGDEFIVVGENISKDVLERAFRKMDESVLEINGEERHRTVPLAVSKGAAFYDAGSDSAYKDVFKRADDAMYQNKSEYYQGQNDRRRR